MDEKQQQKVIRLLKEAWTAVDFFGHNCDLSLRIRSFVNEVEGHTDWPRWRKT